MKFIKRILSIEFLVESILVVFAVANFSTISDYFIHSGMNAITSYSVGVLMGLILIASAMMLSRIERTAEIFNFVLYATLGAAILAAILQSLAYHTITHDWITSIIKGAGFPMVEVALAYSVSLYSTYLKKKDVEEADARFDEQLAIMQRESSMNMDPELIRKEIQASMHEILTARINKFKQDQLAKYQTENIAIANTDEIKIFMQSQDEKFLSLENLLTVEKISVQNMQEKMNEIFARVEDIMTETTQNFSEEKTDEKLQNAAVKNKFSSLEALAIHLANNYNGVATSDLHQSKIAQELSISDASVSRGIKKLQKQERLNGHVDSVVLMK